MTTLPCDVLVAPALVLRKGAPLSALLHALDRRRDRDDIKPLNLQGTAGLEMPAEIADAALRIFNAGDGPPDYDLRAIEKDANVIAAWLTDIILACVVDEIEESAS